MWRILRRQRWWTTGAITVVLALTLVAFTLSPKQYTASGSVWLDHQLDMLTRSSATPVASDALRRNTEIRYLTSLDVATRTVDRLGLSGVRGIGQPARGQALAGPKAHARATEAVAQGIGVTATGASYAVIVNYSAADPVVAAAVVNQVLDQYVAYRLTGGARAEASARRRAELTWARDEMVRTAAATEAYGSAAALMTNDETVRQLRQEVARLHAQIAGAAETERSVARAARVVRLRAFRDEQAQLLADRAQLLQRYGPRYPAVVENGQRILDVQHNLALQGRARETSRAAVRGQAAPVADKGSARVAEQRVRMRQVADRAKARYTELLAVDRRSAAAVSDQTGPYVIARAPIPSAPDFPSPWTFLLAGAAVALLAGGVTALVREAMTPGFRSKKNAERKLGVPVLASVPECARDARTSAFVEPIDLVLAVDGPLDFRAAFDALRMRLHLDGSPGSPRSVAVSSAVAGEGKTTVSICLARSAALAGLRVVLVDCDVRRPAASQALASKPQHGLSDVLDGRATLEQALLLDQPSGAWFLSTKTDESAIDDTVGSERMIALITKLASEFDVVVLDTAPVLALAETRLVATFCDCVLIVARWRTTPIRATQLALNTVRQAGATVSGAALTRTEA